MIEKVPLKSDLDTADKEKVIIVESENKAYVWTKTGWQWQKMPPSIKLL